MALECIFCKIIAGIIPSQIVTETNELLVIKDIYPQATVHYLIIPKKHVIDLMDLNDAQIAAEILFMAQKLGHDLSDKPAFRLITNNGAAAGQSVFHLHFHFLAGDNLSGF